IGQNVSLLLENDQPVGFQAVARDITEIKKLQTYLVDARKKAESSLQAKELFLANMSHEIRTPMNVILGMSKLLEASPMNDQHRDYLHNIRASARNLLVIINDILDFSKVEAGKLDLEVIGFRPATVVEQSRENLDYLTLEKDLYIQTEVDPRVQNVVLLGDPVRLGQVLNNLVSNAIKFTPKGAIRITCALKEDMGNEVELRFEVHDTGIGIAEDKLHTIFSTFHQADASTTRKFGGTGLGLAICKQLVELHRGRIGVTSTVDVGTTFYFEIPYTKGVMADIPATQETDGSALRFDDLRVLLAEDHQMNQAYARSILESVHAKVTIVANGQLAVDALREQPFDLVLMDVQMPVMSGLEATRIIREELKSDVPILALTANAIKGANEACLEAGMNDVMV
ncbi:MAG: ATP-binding protein, partial [Bacteroidota bacterium]